MCCRRCRLYPRIRLTVRYVASASSLQHNMCCDARFLHTKKVCVQVTTSSPMCFFAQQLALVAFNTAITLDCRHVSADMLSRLDSAQFLGPEWEIKRRVRFPIDNSGKGSGLSTFSLKVHACFGRLLDLWSYKQYCFFVWPDPSRPCHNASATRL